MLDAGNRPTIGPCVLTRELAPCASFADGLEPGISGHAADDRARESAHHASIVVRSAASLWRAMMGGAGTDSGASELHGRAVGGEGSDNHHHAERPPVSSKASVRVGPHRAPLSPTLARFLALHLADQSSHVAYRFPVVLGEKERERTRAVMARAALLNHPHILRVETVLIDHAGHPWLITPYTGDVDGVRSLARLLRDKNGQMPTVEAERAVTQLLEAAHAAHEGCAALAGDASVPLPITHHGPIHPEQVLVDRRGSLFIELYGLARALRRREPGPESPAHELLRDEVRSIVEIGYQLVTGLRAEAPLIPAGRLVPGLDPRWDRWFEHGLDPSAGFDSAMEALVRLPSRDPFPAPVSTRIPSRSVLGRLRSGGR